ncbi:MAG: hypothetical protein FWC64_12105 [Treponema sp.]|nr:hypothetical protein [Treponema sp.]
MLSSRFDINAEPPMVVTLLPMVTLVSWLSLNPPRLVTLLGMVTLSSWLELNALLPMVVTLLGTFVHFAHAYS